MWQSGAELQGRSGFWVKRYNNPRLASSPRNSGGIGIAFVVGGLVVAALVLFWLFTGGDASVVDTAPAASDVTISVDETPAPAADTAAETTAPAADSAEQPAPVQPTDN